MVNVTGVKFKDTGKIYYFDPGDFELEAGMNVIVDTSRGIEYGKVVSGNTLVSESNIVQPLRKVIRIATPKDDSHVQALLDKREDALQKCAEQVAELGLDMKLTGVEFAFDNTKVTFFFTSDGRVDFRKLVKTLASVFKMRIELRQIGVRDEARMLGGIGPCGRCLCCNSWMNEFSPVSIKMAKVQNLTLNPTSISGVCGRLMCCLNYENETYIDLRKGMPNVGAKVRTADGVGVVTQVDIFREKVRVRLLVDSAKPADEENLVSEESTYGKSEIRILGRGKTNGKKCQCSKCSMHDAADDVDDDVDPALMETFKELLEE